MFKDFFNLKRKLMPHPERIALDCQVLVIGNGLIGALTTYFFQQKKVSSILLHPSGMEDNNASFEIDHELSDLSKGIDTQGTDELFRSIMDSIYKFDGVMKTVEIEEEHYQRNPQLHYISHSSTEQINGFHLYPGSLVYSSGISFDSKKLTEKIESYCEQQESKIIDDEKIESIVLDQGVAIFTKNYHIRCERLVVTSTRIQDLYFPQEIYEDLLISDELFNSTEELRPLDLDIKFYNSQESKEDNTYILNVASTSEGIVDPIIGELPQYPNVYFNIGNLNILNGIMGSSFLSNLFLNTTLHDPLSLKFISI